MSFMNEFRSGNNGNLLGLNTNHNIDNYDGGLNDFANQVLAIHKDRIARQDRINDLMLQHQLAPINRYAPPLTTNNEISHGLTPANPQIDTKTTNSIDPLALAKLKQGEEKIQLGNEQKKNELGFKYSKESTDSNIRQQRADVYDYKSKHPDHKFDFSGATVKVMNPSDGSVYDSGMPTDKLSMEDRMQLSSSLGTARDTNRLNITGSNNIKRDNNASNNRLNLEDKQQENRMKILRFKQDNKDWKFISGKGGNVMAVDPTDPSQVVDTGIATGTLSDKDRLDLGLKNSLEEIHARGNETRETNLVKPNTKIVSNSQVNQGYINIATELVNSNPQYAPYIKLGKSDNGKVNGFSVNPINGTDDPLYHEINAKIYGKEKGDVTIPSSEKDKNDKSKNKSSDKKSDPLGIR